MHRMRATILGLVLVMLTGCPFTAVNGYECKEACGETGVSKYTTDECVCNQPVKVEIIDASTEVSPAPVTPDEVIEGQWLDEDDTWQRTRLQAVMLARIWVNEVGKMLRPKAGGGTDGEPNLECRLIAHAVLNGRGKIINKETRRKATGYLEVMRELSPRVTGKAPPRLERQEWTSTLPAEGSEQPIGWVDERDGDWRIYADNWATLREAAVDMWVSGDVGEVPGGGVVVTWDMAGVESQRKTICKLAGGPGDEDGILGEGNWFWGWKGDEACVPETVAVADVVGAP
jgi:hypothetical protein